MILRSTYDVEPLIQLEQRCRCSTGNQHCVLYCVLIEEAVRARLAGDSRGARRLKARARDHRSIARRRAGAGR